MTCRPGAGITKPPSVQANVLWSQMMPYDPALLGLLPSTHLALGSRRGSGSPGPPLVTRKRYWSPCPAPGTSTERYAGFACWTSGVEPNPLNVPLTATPTTSGAQTRNVVPPGYTVAPMPLLVEAAVAFVPIAQAM